MIILAILSIIMPLKPWTPFDGSGMFTFPTLTLDPYAFYHYKIASNASTEIQPKRHLYGEYACVDCRQACICIALDGIPQNAVLLSVERVTDIKLTNPLSFE